MTNGVALAHREPERASVPERHAEGRHAEGREEYS
jgi:hypothetical protein